MGDVLPLVAMLAWLATAAIGCYGVHHYQHRLGRTVTADSSAQIVVIIPVRGVPDNLPALWQGLLAQTYAPWRLVFAVESRTDPAFAALSRLATTGRLPVEIIVAGRATDTGQKVHNQLAALATLRPEDGMILFADADIVPPPRLAGAGRAGPWRSDRGGRLGLSLADAEAGQSRDPC